MQNNNDKYSRHDFDFNQRRNTPNDGPVHQLGLRNVIRNPTAPFNIILCVFLKCRGRSGRFERYYTTQRPLRRPAPPGARSINMNRIAKCCSFQIPTQRLSLVQGQCLTRVHVGVSHLN